MRRKVDQTLAPELATHPQRICRVPEARQMLGLRSDSSLYELIAAGRFPRPKRISERAVGWPLKTVLDYLAALPDTEPKPHARRTKGR